MVLTLSTLEQSGQLPYIPLKATDSKASSSPCPSQADEQATAHIAGHQRCSDLKGTSEVSLEQSWLRITYSEEAARGCDF